MNIQELFKSVDPEKVFLSYIRRYDIIESYDHRFEVYQEVEAYEKFKEDLFDFIKIMEMAKIEKNKDILVFVVDLNEVDFDDKKKKRFEVFAVEKEKFLKQIQTNFSFYGESENNIDRFTISFSKVEKVAGYEISDKSLKEYGKEAVVSAICHEMQMFDFGRDNDAIEDFKESLEKSEKDIKEGKCIPAEEVFENLKEEFYSKIEDTDVLEYFKKHDEFENEIKEIKERWISKTINENAKKLIEFVN